MAGVKAATEIWGVPPQQKNVRGTSIEDDLLKLEQAMHASGGVFVSHTTTPLICDYFWNM
jgi:hypothetical protein